MTWPSGGTFGQTHTDQGTDSPAMARADINSALTALAAIIAARGSADGIPSLVGSTIPAAQLPYNAAGAPPQLVNISGAPRVPVGFLPAGLANGVASLDGSGKVPTSQLPVGAAGPLRMVSWRQPVVGASWEIPSGVFRLEVIVTGAGGGGGTRAGSSGKHGGGGGAGGTSIGVFNVVPGQFVTITVGEGGAAGAAGDNPGADGGDSVVVIPTTDAGGSSVTLTGGGGGGGAEGSVDASAGASGTASASDVLASILNLKGGLGNGGFEDRGGNGGASYWQGGNSNGAGQAFGGGGAPGGDETLAFKGAHGLVVIRY